MKLTWAKFNLAAAMGVVAFAVYILVDALKLHAGLKQQFAPLSPLAQQIGATCHNDGDGEWIRSFEKKQMALRPFIAVPGCAISHVGYLNMASAAPALERVALDPNNPHSGLAKSVLRKTRG